MRPEHGSAAVEQSARLAGKHLFVTGGTRGIGLAITAAALARGARVSFVGTTSDGVRNAEADLHNSGADVAGFQADVTDEAAVHAAVTAASERFGPIDVLVANAGRSSVHGPLRDSSPAAWWSDVSVNVLGVAHCAAAVLPSMTERGMGRIIAMVSGTAGRPSPYNSAYSCSKAAVVRLVDCLAEEVREDGIAVFALRPGNVQTDMLAAFAESEEIRRWIPGDIARLRPQSPDRAVAATLWLAEGDGDALSGRWIDAEDDLPALAARAGDIAAADLYQLRRRKA
ncbi:SDR family NAD(P)-dependent oxidoreductase [Nocardia jiangxiensis]|uniref:SDR family NAD(P)-dependent oxidoreductase n=1 Tax=Nocardia jiangxiensis TaxID=282685 RepID=A0ABW6SC54_9NOCA|nr:SDR family NAD(P)-dependent oxidoreductase [Nocardia jiangxiensis]